MSDDESVEVAIDANLALGYMEHTGYDDDGNPLYRITNAGIRHIVALLADRSEDDR